MFICSDVFSLILQATGGALADTASTIPESFKGIDIMIAGLAFQVFSLTVFAALSADLAWKVRKGRDPQRPLRLSCSKRKLHRFLWGMCPEKPAHTQHDEFEGINIILGIGVALLAIYIRSCFRVAELQGGFQSGLANDEVTFMVLEGAIIVVASTALTVIHPGIIFGKSWGAANIHNGEDGEMKG